MQKRINGKLYNTETSKELARINSGRSPSDSNYYEEALYRTKSGNFFLHGWGHGNSRYGEWLGTSGSDGEKIIPFTLEEAKQWGTNNLSKAQSAEIFKKLEQKKLKITADVLVDTKNVIDRLKKNTKKSTGEIIDTAIRMMEEEKMEKIKIYGMDEEVMVNLDQDTFIDEATGYEIYIAEDGRWIAEDDALGEWVQIKG